MSSLEKRQKNALSNTSFSVYHLGQYFFIYCFFTEKKNKLKNDRGQTKIQCWKKSSIWFKIKAKIRLTLDINCLVNSIKKFIPIFDMRQTRLFDWSVEISCVLLNNARNMSKSSLKFMGTEMGEIGELGIAAWVPNIESRESLLWNVELMKQK